MERICTCPNCRFSRNEISKEEYAWYLKGKIEATFQILNAYKLERYGKSKGNLPWNISGRMNLDDARCMLSELIKDKFDNPDIALLQPENFTLKG